MDLKSISFDLPWPPSTNKYWQPIIRRRKRGGHYPTLIRTSHANNWRAQAKIIMLSKFGRPLFEEPIAVEIIQHPKTKNAQDLDNCLKAVLDAMNDLIYRDDSQISELILKRGDICKIDPRLAITIKRLG